MGASLISPGRCSSETLGPLRPLPRVSAVPHCLQGLPELCLHRKAASAGIHIAEWAPRVRTSSTWPPGPNLVSHGWKVLERRERAMWGLGAAGGIFPVPCKLEMGRLSGH